MKTLILILKPAPEGYLAQFSTYSQWTNHVIYYDVAFITVTYAL